jgi:hypothetical protein
MLHIAPGIQSVTSVTHRGSTDFWRIYICTTWQKVLKNFMHGETQRTVNSESTAFDHTPQP